VQKCAVRGVHIDHLSGKMKTLGVISVTLLLGATVPASAQILPIQGSATGADFRQQCPARENVIGFNARVGDGLHAISIICGRRTLNPLSYVLEPGARGVPAGGGGGTAAPDHRCAGTREAVSSIGFSVSTTGSESEQLATFEFACREIFRPYNRRTSRVVVPGGSDPSVQAGQRCPVGSVATGIRGRASDRVHALGLICGPVAAPRPVPASEQPAAAPTKSPGNVPQTAHGASKARIGDRVSQPRATPGKARPAEPERPDTAPSSPPLATNDSALTYQNPTNPAGDRLNSCLGLPNRDCGNPAADSFCKAKGHRTATAYASEIVRWSSATWNGQQCRQARCSAFTSITCER
jgi:hypothetical protein